MHYEELKKHINVDFAILENQEISKERTSYPLKQTQKLREKYRSAIEQVEQYGEEKFNETFIRLVNDTSETHWDNYAVSEELAIKEHCLYIKQNLDSIRDYIKFFQELFSDPSFFIKRKEGKYKTEDIMACIVDPERVSDRLLENLKLCDFSNLKNNPLERLRKKSDIYVINALKHIYMNVKQLKVLNTKCLLLGEVYTRDQKLNKTLEKYNKYVAGKIIQIQNIPKKHVILDLGGKIDGVQFDNKKIVFFDNLEMYLKSLDHITKSVINDNVFISDLNAKLYLARMYADLWKKDTPKSQKEFLKQQIFSCCDYVINKLKNSYNENKVVARSFIEGIRNLKNPRNMIATLQASINNLEKRKRPADQYYMYREGVYFRSKNILLEIRKDFDIKRSLFYSLEKDINRLLFLKGNENSTTFDLSRGFLDTHIVVSHYPYNLLANMINKKKEILYQEIETEDRNEYENAYIKQIKYLFFLEKYFYEEFKNLIVFEEEHLEYLKEQVNAIKSVFKINFPKENKEILGDLKPSYEALNDYLDFVLNSIEDVYKNKSFKSFSAKSIINFKKIYSVFEKL